MRSVRAASGPSEPSVLVRVAVLHQLDDCTVDLHECDAQEVVAAPGRVEGLGENRMALDRGAEVVYAVRDVGRRAERTADRRVGLEAQPFDVATAGARARD